jgi:murein DD-endopeptidase MepM/ murein hydrolase activator NlpD
MGCGAAAPTELAGPGGRAAARLTAFSAPIPVLAEGRLQLVYELLLENVGATTLSPTRLDVEGRRTYRFEAGALAGLLERARLPPGDRGLVYLRLEADPADRPDTLLHRLTLATETGELVAIEVGVDLSESLPLSLGPPLAGGDWAGIGIGNDAGHRRAAPAFGVQRRIAQRFAIDWLQIGSDGQTFSGDPLRNASYHAYGAPLLAMADGVVAGARDGIAENVPGRLPPAGSLPLGGNHVLLQVTEELALLYAHMIPGSLRVGVGDRVARGEVLGLLGNSGNSSQPHLHLHLARVLDVSSESTLNADGRPFVLERFTLLSGRSVLGVREHELPLEGAVIRFEP